MTWEMKVECCQNQLLFYLSSFSWKIVTYPFEVGHSFHCQQMVSWGVSWIVEWGLNWLATCWICWPWCSGLWICWLWIWCWWLFDCHVPLLYLESCNEKYHSDLGYLSTYLGHLNSTLHLEVDLSNILSWPCW